MSNLEEIPRVDSDNNINSETSVASSTRRQSTSNNNLLNSNSKLLQSSSSNVSTNADHDERSQRITVILPENPSKEQIYDVISKCDIDIEKCYASPILNRIIHEYMHTLKVEEISHFFNDYTKYINCKDLKDKQELYQYILDTYVVRTGKYPLNLPGNIVKDLIDNHFNNTKAIKVYKKPSNNLQTFKDDPLSDMIHNQKHTLQHDIFPRFIRSEAFINILVQYPNLVAKVAKERHFANLNVDKLDSRNFRTPLLTDADVQFIRSVSQDSYMWKMIKSKIFVSFNGGNGCNMNSYYKKGNPLTKAPEFDKGDLIKYEGVLDYSLERCVYTLMHEDRVVKFDKDLRELHDEQYIEGENLEFLHNKYAKTDKKKRECLITKWRHRMAGPFRILKDDYCKTIIGAISDKTNRSITIVMKPYLIDKSDKEISKMNFLGFIYFQFNKINEYQTRYCSGGITRFGWNLNKLTSKVVGSRNEAIYTGMVNCIKEYSHKTIEELKDGKDTWHRCINYAIKNHENFKYKSELGGNSGSDVSSIRSDVSN